MKRKRKKTKCQQESQREGLQIRTDRNGQTKNEKKNISIYSKTSTKQGKQRCKPKR